MGETTADVSQLIKPENLVYERPKLLTDAVMHYCPGCSHGVVHKLIAEIVEEMGMKDRTTGIAPVGCGVFAYNYIDIDWQEAAHGRAPALATAVKRLAPDNLVFTYQATVTSLLSVLLRLFMQLTVVRISLLSLSITVSTV